MINDGYGWSMNMGWGFPFMGLFFFIFFIIGVIYVIKLIFSSSNEKNHPVSESPIDILKQRYARGEINEQTFETMKQKLT